MLKGMAGAVALTAALMMAASPAAAFDETKYPDLSGQSQAAGGRQSMGPDQASRSRPAAAPHAGISGRVRGQHGRPARGWAGQRSVVALRPLRHAAHHDGRLQHGDHHQAGHHAYVVRPLPAAPHLYRGPRLAQGHRAELPRLLHRQWIDEDGDGRYDALEIETRGLKGPRTYEGTG